jgi:hypothetical protein
LRTITPVSGFANKIVTGDTNLAIFSGADHFQSNLAER